MAADSPTPLAIEASGLIKSFGKTRALDGVDLRVPRGMVYGLLGPNGAGKSTVVRVLATLLRPDEGTALVDGLDVVRQAKAVRTRIGLAGQYAAVDEYLTGRENLVMFGMLSGLWRSQAKARASDLLAQFDLVDAADRPSKGYSGGMRRRLDLAASLASRPLVLYLDEPTTGLDPRSRLTMWGVIQGLVDDGTTVLLTTQYLEEADRLAQRIAVIDRGRVIAEGTPAQLKSRVGGEGLEVAVVDPADLEAVRAIVARFASDEVFVDVERRRVRAAVSDGARALSGVAAAIAASGITTEDVGLHRPTLDEVFLAITGRPVDDPVDEEGQDAGDAGGDPPGPSANAPGDAPARLRPGRPRPPA
ncbi:MAG: ATP-binding cassette domain-containing protein [Actinobacteria bacterium]|nr:ATP-binding cassette domain-containing protein [Actinomycetota bacterium]